VPTKINCSTSLLLNESSDRQSSQNSLLQSPAVSISRPASIMSHFMATSVILLSFTLHINYCNSLLINLPAAQTNRFQLVTNSAARAVTKTHTFHHNTPILKSLHCTKYIRELYTWFSLTHIGLNLSKLVNYLTSALFFSLFPSHRCNINININICSIKLK